MWGRCDHCGHRAQIAAWFGGLALMTCTFCGNGPVVMQSPKQTSPTVQTTHAPQSVSSLRPADIPAYEDEPDSGQEAHSPPPPAADKALGASLPGPAVPAVIRSAPVRAQIPLLPVGRIYPSPV